MPPLISVVIPVRNGRRTIGRCLQAAMESRFEDFEVVVADDGSTDDTAAIVTEVAAGTDKLRLLQLPHRGAAGARNAGAAAAHGEFLFFIDADCLLEPDAVANAARAMQGTDPKTVVGGTYTLAAPGENFFGKFQSAFIHHSETKYPDRPDYIASHALVIRKATFDATGGFPAQFMPIIEDVEYAHRLRRTGHRLVMDASILVQHVFLFTLRGSLRNAFKKSRFWTRYSLHNKDVFADSGTASFELKAATAALGATILLVLGWFFTGLPILLWPLPLLWAATLVVCFGLLRAYFRAGGLSLLLPAMLYFFAIYPIPVGLGAVVGVLEYPRKGVH
ncbi:MAG: glycosyltransferase [Planctomycetes bacterium]|nr:glycosyltransferase [Planctomycetota bacterium]MCB9886891.1 glycosyltransferase [Planctomycetota bacterium]